MKTPRWLIFAATMLAATAGSFAADTNAAPSATPATNAPVVATPPAPPIAPSTDSSTAVPATNAEPVAALQFPKLSLPPLLDQVVRLNQSGTDETVVRAYIEKAAPPYQITGNEIIQLQDLGVPQGVILALIEHSKSAATPPAVAPAEETPPPVPNEPEAGNQAATGTMTNDPAPGSAEAAADFRDSLAPYGTWLEVPGYGYCWQPTVVVVNPSWRPYCDYGDWRWSSSGWYWHSYYSWGWAPFHYGRWFSHPGRGWLWCPDRVWGPAWVSWRNSATHCGWAPLPPGACFIAGRGWTFRGVRVGLDFSFGLGSAHFTFVSHKRFADRHVGSHAIRGDAALAHYRNTRVINNYAAGPNNRPINRGVGRHQIAAASQSPIREVAATDLPRAGSRIAAPASARRAVARATQASRTPSTPAVARPSVAQGSRMLNRPAASQPVFPQRTQRTPSRSVVAGGGAVPRAMPNYSQNLARRPATSAQPRRSVAASPQRPVMAAPRSQPRTFNHGMGTPRPNRTFAPAAPQRFGSVGARPSVSPGGGSFRAAPRAMPQTRAPMGGRSTAARR